VVLAVVLTLCFERDWGAAGLAAVAALLVFTAGYRDVFTRWLPLRHYGDSDS